MHKKGIIAYGTEEDRAKLAELAAIEGLSASKWLLRMIRVEHQKRFGEKK